jgi:hypothetical protein
LLGAFADAHFGKRKPGRPKTWDDDELLKDYVALIKRFLPQLFERLDEEEILFLRGPHNGEFFLSLPKYQHLKARTIEKRLRAAQRKTRVTPRA